MNAKSYKYIFILIGLSCLGIIAMQLSWLYQQYENGKEEIRKDIKTALKEVNKEISKLYSTTAELDEDHIDNLDYYFRSPDSTMTFIFESLERQTNWDGSKYTLDGTLREKRIKDFKKFISTLDIEDRFSESFIVLYGNIDTSINQSKNWKMLVKDQGVHELLDKKLKENSIGGTFDFGIYNRDKNHWDYLSNPGDSVQIKESIYKQAFVTDETEIYLSLEQDRYVLLKKILPYIVLSLLFIAIILGSFYFLLRIIWNQKKVTEIKTDFINNMSHEFKTPIATIDFAVANIKNPQFIQDETLIHQFADIIKKENARMNLQVEKVLQAALEKNESNLDLKKVDLHEIISAQIKSATLKLDKSDNILGNIVAKQFVVKGDEAHLTNVISTLLENAIKYSKADKIIEVTSRSDDAFIYIDIKDNGIGINAKDQSMIFDKFFRVSTGNLHNVKGFGLGLHYARNIIQQHQGELVVSSKIGEGSTFTIKLPLY